MKKSFYWLLKPICYLEISTLSMIAVLVTIDSVMAKPICYFLDANGRRVNLSFVCQHKPTSSNKPPAQTQNTPPPPQSNTTPEKKAPAPAEKNSQSNNSETGNKVDDKSSQPDSNERKIPLLKN